MVGTVSPRVSKFVLSSKWFLNSLNGCLVQAALTEAHPDYMVALIPMCPLQGSSYARPTRDLDEILFALKGLLYWGQICIPTEDALIYKSDISKNQDSKGGSSMYAYFLDESQPRST
nr:hypothetical protein [Tanacetum cinerariifolium]